MSRLSLLALLGVGLLAATASAQNAGEGRARRGWRSGGDVSEAVTLTDEQKKKVDELQEKLSEKMREQFSGRARDDAAMEKWRALREQVVAAAEAGDDAKVEALNKEMEGIGWRAERTKLVSEFYDDVAKLLTPEQKKQFEVWRKLQDSGVPANLLNSPEALKAAVKKLKISDEKKKEIDAAFEKYEEQVKSVKADDAAGKREATQALATAVVAQLTPSQKVVLTEADRASRRRARGN